jgi:hypothetical protein
MASEFSIEKEGLGMRMLGKTLGLQLAMQMRQLHGWHLE